MSKAEIEKEIVKVVKMMDRQSRSFSTKVSTIRKTRARYEELVRQAKEIAE